MDLLQFTNPNLFKSICLDQETLIIESKDSKYTFHINFKDEIKGVDFYELAIATQTSSGYINKSGTAKVIQNFIIETLSNQNVPIPKEDDIKSSKPSSKKIISKSNSSSKKFYQNIKR
ncbi:hypothetical protein QOZ84_00235 [Romboutsia sedimentorum]|uniref:Uncharacterized protein n=1 Tax=Romboutsia sedimentorum TaxID=1368474 RepID=A0ABT7E4W2_9FIRM|nr:hypothetical protein [Romboutsia sedimentorum]MDK2561960.1 hypothetical protein [Romboutsia sedimentorum]